ncbi:MAG: glycosyltransferase [Nitrosotalea sp.]
MSSHFQDSDKLVTIIIPTKDNVKLLKPCIESIETKPSYTNYEIIIVDNNSKKEETKRYLSRPKTQGTFL